MIIPAPETVRQAYDRVSANERHPGLLQDKFLLPCPDQKSQRDRLGEIVIAHSQTEAAILEEPRARRSAMLRGLGAATWSRVSASPLVLHMARPSSLENAGIALHPIYGFPLLPGSGLKGLARSLAETVWLANQPEAERDAGRALIERIFGSSGLIHADPRTAGENQAEMATSASPNAEPETDGRTGAGAGAVTFHDAWPESWPKLFVEIVNNHHPRYYEGDESSLPGDWDPPLPVYFLAIRPGERFQFALTRNRTAINDPDGDRLLAQARRWLDDGLTELGNGAKTSVGYGAFQPESPSPLLEPAAAPASAPTLAARIACKFEIELTTPAFLAGAFQVSDDCDLRSTTFRGLLRFWWRTLHSNHLTNAELRRLDATIWGDSRLGSTLRTVVRPGEIRGPQRYKVRSPKSRFIPDPRFKKRHKLEEPPPRTTQGLFYLSYGMDDHPNVPPRQYLEAGSWWTAQLIARTRPASSLPGLDADLLFEQAMAALWLLIRYGGAGSKSRKGFGSLQERGDVPYPGWADWSYERCQTAAKRLRDALSLPTIPESRPNKPPSVESAIRLGPFATSWTDEWRALDQLGFIYQSFAQRFRHDHDQTGALPTVWGRSSPDGVTKASLGLPRRIHGPRDDAPLKGQEPESWQPSRWLDFPHRDPNKTPKEARHASPIHFHLSRDPSGRFAISAIAFPSMALPNWESSRKMLAACLDHVGKEMEARAHR